jgi:ribose 5-phosphate isomerase B
MRVALGADHAGVALKSYVKQFLTERQLTYQDFGSESNESVDYPDFALSVANSVASGSTDRGILICGSGIGMAIVANKVQGIRAAPVTTTDLARMVRQHNDANVLTLGARALTAGDALKIVEVFLATPFDGGRHQRRVDKITAVEMKPLVSNHDIEGTE